MKRSAELQRTALGMLRRLTRPGEADIRRRDVVWSHRPGHRGGRWRDRPRQGPPMIRFHRVTPRL